MATLLADPPSPLGAPQAPPSEGPETPPAPAVAASPTRTCANCGGPLQSGQDWCLQCGAGAPGSLSTPARNSRRGAMVLGAALLLIAGAATAAYAAWGPTTTHRVIAIVAQQAPAAPTAPAAPVTPAPLGTPTTIQPLAKTVKPPKIPLTAATPKPATPAQPAAGSTTTPTRTTGSSNAGAVAPSGQPTPISLDTNAAATYNPYAYPVARFGDPSLAIDGEIATAWTAQVDPAVAPLMAEGLVIDLKAARKLSALGLVTSTPGMTIQVYGSTSKTLPTSITDPAWVHLTRSLLEKNKHARITLGRSTTAFRFVTLWIAKAPAGSIGTAQAPGRVSVNELELFAA